MYFISISSLHIKWGVGGGGANAPNPNTNYENLSWAEWNTMNQADLAKAKELYDEPISLN